MINGSNGDFFCAGVLGRPAIHSRSPQLFRAFFRSKNIRAEYLRLAVGGVEEMRSIARFLPVRFLNITSPFKYEVDMFAGQNISEPTAKNVLWKSNDVWEAFNTDVEGIRGPLAPWLDQEGQNILIIGSGGAAEAALRVLKDQNPQICNRTESKAVSLVEKYGSGIVRAWSDLQQAVKMANIIVYTIPGQESLARGITFSPGTVILDANYEDSLERANLIDGRVTYLNGYDWLIHQALPVMERFVPGYTPDLSLLREALEQDHLAKLDRIALIGLPAAGKSSVGQVLAKKLGFRYLDLDREIEQVAGMDIPSIFREKGAPWFRETESRVLFSTLQADKVVIACGGGVITSRTNRKQLMQEAFPIWLMIDPEIAARRLDSGGRPLFDDGNMKEIMYRLHKERMPAYAQVSELCIDTSNRSIDDVVKSLYEAYDSVR